MSFWHDIVGSAGVALIVGTYFFIQAGWVSSRNLAYSAGNLAGAALVMVSLSQKFNIAAFILEAFWFLISCYGVFAWARAKAR